MKRLHVSRRWAAGLLGLGLLLVGLSAGAGAETGSAYDLTWFSVDGGGGTASTGGAYSLGGTIGQPDAGALSGGTYNLSGGFWAGAPCGTALAGHLTFQGLAQPGPGNVQTITLKLQPT